MHTLVASTANDIPLKWDYTLLNWETCETNENGSEQSRTSAKNENDNTQQNDRLEPSNLREWCLYPVGVWLKGLILKKANSANLLILLSYEQKRWHLEISIYSPELSKWC